MSGRYESRRKRRFPVGAGAALILTALICICLLCFAALTVVSAQADLRLTQKYAEQTAGYYEAFGAGQEFLAGIDAQLKEIYEDANAGSAPSASDTDHAPETAADRYYAGAALLDACVDPDENEGAWYDEIQSILANTAGEPEGDAAASDEAAAEESEGDAAPSGEAAADESEGDAGAGETEASSAPLLLFTQEISDTQTYLLLVRVQYPDPGSDEADAFYEILASKTVTTVIYDYDAALNVITE